MNYDDLCSAILKIDSNIRFAGVANNKSELIAQNNRENLENFLNPDEVKMSVHYTLERWEKTSNLSHKIGTEKSSVIEYDKVALITIPFNKKELLLISTEPGAEYSKIISKASEFLKEFD
jgi:transcriptional regulator of heat shock response